LTVLMHFLGLKLPKPFRQEKIYRMLIRISSLFVYIIIAIGPSLDRYCAIIDRVCTASAPLRGWKMRGPSG
jgi:hypothetical protein